VTGDSFEQAGWRFEVVDMDGRKIDKLLVRAPSRTKRKHVAASPAQ
jgi:putative hemolysin